MWTIFEFFMGLVQAPTDLPDSLTIPRLSEQWSGVDALVPETGRKEHRELALASSHQLFTDTIYEETSAGMVDIHWYRAFQNFDPIRLPRSVSEADVNANYGDFLNGVSTLVSAT